MSHPGHPVLSASGVIAEDRPRINTALYTVDVYETAVGITVDVETHGTHILVDASGGAVTITLPDPGSSAKHVNAGIFVKKVDSSVNAVTVDTAGSPTIDGAASVSLSSQYDGVKVFSNNAGTQWYKEKTT